MGKLKPFRSLHELHRLKDCFGNEKELCNYLEDNLDKFVSQWFLEELAYYKREFTIDKALLFGRSPRIDFLLITKSQKRIGIECKRVSQNFHESVRSISQLLGYGVLAEERKASFDELFLITSRFEPTTLKIIHKYHLPIRYLVLTKEYTYEIKQ